MSTRTTTRLTHTLAPRVRHRARIIAAVAVTLLVGAAFLQDALERRAAAVEQPQIIYQSVIIIATPTPAPTAAPVPTAEPQIVYATVEVPIYVEAPVEAVPTYAPPTDAPEKASTTGARPHDETWHPPQAAPADPCATWQGVPYALPEGC